MAEVILLTGAEDDVLSFYFEIFEFDELRAESFSSAVDQTLFNLSLHPLLGSEFKGGFRRKLIAKFYDYGIFYRNEARGVVIHAILDLRQSPDLISRRLGQD